MHSSQFGITFTDSRGPVNSDGPIHCIRSLNRMVRYSVMPVCAYCPKFLSSQHPMLKPAGSVCVDLFQAHNIRYFFQNNIWSQPTKEKAKFFFFLGGFCGVFFFFLF